MKETTKKNSISFLILILGIGIIVGGILTMALYHFMIWQSYVIIGVIMGIAVWMILKTFFSKSLKSKKIPIKEENNIYDRQIHDR